MLHLPDLPHPHLPHPHVPTVLAEAAAKPLHAAATVIEVAAWFTRDLSCGAYGHEPVARDAGIGCARCAKHVEATGSGRVRWVA